MEEEVKTKKTNKKNLDMTDGPILKEILLFAVPLFVGNLFQLLYNIVDSIVVGNCNGKEALAAVSSSGSLISFFVSFIVGIGAGAGIVIATHFGSGNKERMKNAIHTTVAFGLVSSVILTLLGYFLAPIMLKWMKTDESVLPDAIKYFKTYFLGVSFTVMYNMGSAIFRAIGDSRHPLYYLIAASLLNVLLDLLFVLKFKMGVVGAGVATICSQALSAGLTFGHLFITKDEYRVEIKKIRFYKEEIGPIMQIGLPNGLQNSIISLSNVFIQQNINVFGASAQAGCGAYQKIEGFATLPSGSFATALSNFVGQNMGAKKHDRVKKGSKLGLLTSMITCEVLGLILFIFAPQFISMFNRDSEVVSYGVSMCRNIVLAYFMLAFSHGIAAVLRGAGISKFPMWVMIVCWCFVRIGGIPLALHFYNDIRVVFWFYPLTWTISLIVLTIFYFKYDWVHYLEKKEQKKELQKSNSLK